MFPGISANRSGAAWTWTMALITLLLTGCTSTPQHTSATVPEAKPPATTTRPAIRMGRYNLVEIGADVAQQDLMEQVVEIDIPNSISANVGETLRYVLQRSGYRLCDSHELTAVLDGLPLPAVHYHLGPITLREALLVLAGPGWRLELNPSERRVCFKPVSTTDDPDSHAEIQR